MGHVIRKGYFISVEGGEGSGKTTQINRLAEHLTEKNYKVITTREPGGTDEGENIRALLVQRGGGSWTAMAETLLLYAARIMHVENIIKPAIIKGKIVICDRFSDSTLAYQGYGRQQDIDKIKSIEQITLGDFKPDLTLILDIDPEYGLKRSQKRLTKTEDGDQTEDRFERLDIEFHKRLRQGFLDIAQKEPNRCKIIDASQQSKDVFEDIKKIINEFI